MRRKYVRPKKAADEVKSEASTARKSAAESVKAEPSLDTAAQEADYEWDYIGDECDTTEVGVKYRRRVTDMDRRKNGAAARIGNGTFSGSIAYDIKREHKKSNYSIFNSTKYFRDCHDIKSVNDKYKELLKKYHPDNPKTGEAGKFMDMKLEYEKIQSHYSQSI